MKAGSTQNAARKRYPRPSIQPGGAQTPEHVPSSHAAAAEHPVHGHTEIVPTRFKKLPKGTDYYVWGISNFYQYNSINKENRE